MDFAWERQTKKSTLSDVVGFKNLMAGEAHEYLDLATIAYQTTRLSDICREKVLKYYGHVVRREK